jgi:hypothetical protein
MRNLGILARKGSLESGALNFLPPNFPYFVGKFARLRILLHGRQMILSTMSGFMPL